MEKSFSKARDYAYRLLSYRPRSIKEMKDRLKRKSYDDETIEELISYLEDLNYLNDREFAKFWTTAKLSSKAVGTLLLSHELKTKGISQEIVDGVINDIKASYDEYEIARKEALNRIKRYGNLEEIKSKRRLYGHLMRRGFSREVILEVMKEAFG